ncbi:MAG: HAD family phosphatase [Clostridia bacterium]|nr:HAD family phosphatase [Clostridia bacterium]
MQEFNSLNFEAKVLTKFLLDGRINSLGAATATMVISGERKMGNMGRFDGMLICTDLDGTLLKNDKTISYENMEAIEYFKQEGGYFTFVTGRMPFFVSYITDTIKPNAPFGCINGGGLFDWVKEEYVWTAVMPDTVIELVKHIDDNFPDVGIQVNTFYKTYFCKENQTMKNFRKRTKLENIVCHYNDVKEPIAKILFGSENEQEIKNIEKMLKSHPLANGFDFIRSEKTLYEILPKGIGKGTSVKNLCRHLNIDVNKTIAIGDYNNDISMFKASGIGIAVSNACDEALAEADFITVSNEEHAIARVIYDLESGKYAL